MLSSPAIRLYGALVAAIFLTAAPAMAQFQPRRLEDPATGEKFLVEGSAGFWGPGASMQVRSAALGLAADNIDAKEDLGLTDSRFREVHLVLKAARKHKLRFQYIPIHYSKEGHRIARQVVFNGQRYDAQIPINWNIEWKAYRFSYEYDFIVRSRGFGGVILDAKYTDIYASLQAPLPGLQFVHAKGPIPAIGGIARVYVVPNISITGELTGITIPDSISQRFKDLQPDGHYFDLDIYGTLNFTNNVGAQIGYRSLDVGVAYLDNGIANGVDFKLRGLYFGIVARY